MAGMSPAAIICEITNPDGTMAKGTEVDKFARTHDLVMLSIAELVDHHRSSEANREKLISRPHLFVGSKLNRR
jgi:3,4-dihydroxy-2-butanone 4-phosphate synthase